MNIDRMTKFASTMREVSLTNTISVTGINEEGQDVKFGLPISYSILKRFAKSWLEFSKSVGSHPNERWELHTRKAGICLNLGVYILMDELNGYAENGDSEIDGDSKMIVHIDGKRVGVRAGTISWRVSMALKELFSVFGDTEFSEWDFPFNTEGDDYEVECYELRAHKNHKRIQFIETILGADKYLQLTPEIAEGWDDLFKNGDVTMYPYTQDTSRPVKITKVDVVQAAKDYLAWIDSGAKNAGGFTTGAGLCLNFAYAHTDAKLGAKTLRSAIYDNHGDMIDTACASRAYLADMMAYWFSQVVHTYSAPFNASSTDYWDEKEIGCHLNEGRVQFVKAIIEWSKL